MRDNAAFYNSAARGAFLNDTPGLQWQSVGGRMPHGAGLKEAVDDNGVPPRGDAVAPRHRSAWPRLPGVLPERPAVPRHASGPRDGGRAVDRLQPLDRRACAAAGAAHEGDALSAVQHAGGGAKRPSSASWASRASPAFVVTSTRYQPVHANEYMRLYAMLEEAGAPVAFHAHHNWQNEYTKTAQSLHLDARAVVRA